MSAPSPAPCTFVSSCHPPVLLQAPALHHCRASPSRHTGEPAAATQAHSAAGGRQTQTQFPPSSELRSTDLFGFVACTCTCKLPQTRLFPAPPVSARCIYPVQSPTLGPPAGRRRPSSGSPRPFIPLPKAWARCRGGGCWGRCTLAFTA